MVTDYATFAYLCDVYVLEEHRGHGLGKRMMREVMAHPALPARAASMLATRDAHGLYRQSGFVDAGGAGNLMEIVRPDIYSHLGRSWPSDGAPYTAAHEIRRLDA